MWRGSACFCARQAQKAWAASSSSNSASSSGANRTQLRLTIDSAEQLPAAEAVIAALYRVPDALSSLQQQQLIDAVFIADKLGAADVAAQAVQMLITAAEQELSAAAVTALAQLHAWPTCLLPLLLPMVRRASCFQAASDVAAIAAADTGSRVQRMLLAVLGNLEAVLRDQQLQTLLMQLPLPALQLLLSSDSLFVSSEDTVLYTAITYIGMMADNWQTGQAVLAPLVRAPHLSGSVLSGQALSSSSSSTMLLSSYNKQLRQLISHKLATGGAPVPASVLRLMTGVPPSWLLEQRQLIAAGNVQMEWRLPVEQIAAACRDSFAGNRTVTIECGADGVDAMA
jgi:hypothetical protein